ncbi:MAG: response regulator [Chitinophagales bacterium]|nr:response regulator [Chitinophagales bacterium]
MNNSKLILIVDDDSDDQELFTEAVDEVNPEIKCISAVNGQDALEFLREQDGKLPDFIFLDLNMPRLNGKQCLAEIKRSKRFRNIPVIIYTTSKLDEDVKETKKLGAAYFLTKPSKFSDLKNAISFLVNEKADSKKLKLEFLQPL